MNGLALIQTDNSELRQLFAHGLIVWRLADEYDAAQERGYVAGHGGGRNFKVGDPNVETHSDGPNRVGGDNAIITIADRGLRHEHIHDARLTRDAEVVELGIGTRTLGCRGHVGDHNMPGSQQGQLINLLPEQEKVAGVTEPRLVHLKPQNPKGAKGSVGADIVADPNDVWPATAADQLGLGLAADRHLPLTPEQWAGRTPSQTTSSSPNQEGAL